MQHYHVNNFSSDRDACWIADVPDLKYYGAHGSSVAEAARETEDAMVLWLKTAAENSDAIPEPRYRPDALHQAA